MKFIKYACLTSILALTNGLVHAENTMLAYDSSPLTPGARIVAGDLSKNEFFIIGKDDQAAVKTLAKENHPPATKAIAPTVQVAQQSHETETRVKLVAQIRTALNSTLKSPKTVHIALNSAKTHAPKHSLTAKQKVQKVKPIPEIKQVAQAKIHHSTAKQIKNKSHIANNQSLSKKLIRAHLAKLTKHHYEFVSLTKKRLKIKSAYHNRYHVDKKLAMAKV